MRPLSDRELAAFCQQVTMILKSGIMIHAGMQMIADDTSSPMKKAIYQKAADVLSENNPLHNALRSTSAFPEYFISMVEIGSESGSLDTVMESLSTYYNRRHNMMENLKSAIVYPCILILMMSVVLVFLASTVLPVFERVFNNLGAELSPGIILLMNIGSSFSQYSLFFILFTLFLLAIAFLLFRTEGGKSALSQFMAKRKASEGFSIASFTSSMSLMLSSGLDLERSAELSLQVVSNEGVKAKVMECLQVMEAEQLSFVDAVEKVQLFSSSTLGLLSMGAKSGSIDSAMQYMADLYEEEYEKALVKRVSLIEPISITIISLLIGSILISVMFPLLGILSSIG